MALLKALLMGEDREAEVNGSLHLAGATEITPGVFFVGNVLALVGEDEDEREDGYMPWMVYPSTRAKFEYYDARRRWLAGMDAGTATWAERPEPPSCEGRY